jgi:hypothetical protein
LIEDRNERDERRTMMTETKEGRLEKGRRERGMILVFGGYEEERGGN